MERQRALEEAAAQRLPREQCEEVIARIGERDNRILDFLERQGKVGSLLDVGCGRGILMADAMRRGWSVKGVEPSRTMAEEGAHKRGLDIFVGTLREAGFAGASFDAVVFSHSLEHLPEPRADLETAAKLLREGGWVYIETPNWDSLSRRILGRRWWNIQMLNHLYYFNRRSLSSLCLGAGLRVQAMRGIHFDPLAVLIRLGHYGDPAYGKMAKINECRERLMKVRGVWRASTILDAVARAMLRRSTLNDYLACWAQKQ